MGLFILKKGEQMVQGFPVNRSYTKAEADAKFGGSGGYQLPTSGIVNGTNKAFTFATAPNVLVIDNIPTQKVNSDSTINWVGSTNITLTVAPNYDLYALS